MTLDPRRHAVRSDLADVRLADRVFAPHYAEPVPCRIGQEATLRADRDPASAEVAHLAAGDAFELLDLVGDDAWGIAVARERVGWCDRRALAFA